MQIFLAPHNDDETLFGAYTIMRHKPLVVICTDSYIQQERGDRATTEQRKQESIDAMQILGANVQFLNIPDKQFTSSALEKSLRQFGQPDMVYAPAMEKGGNWIHNSVGLVADKVFNHVMHYTTYVAGNDKTKGRIIVHPTPEEKKLKKEALKCYKSQMGIPSCAVFFKHKHVLKYESYE